MKVKLKCNTYMMYHGTSNSIANYLSKGNIDVSKGGGELGRGFYLGNVDYVARQWAIKKYGINNYALLTVKRDDGLNWVHGLTWIVLDKKNTKDLYEFIKVNGLGRTEMGCIDVLEGHIVGKDFNNFVKQYKWESQMSESILNGACNLNVAK